MNLAQHPKKVSTCQQSQRVIVPILTKVDQSFKQLEVDDDGYHEKDNDTVYCEVTAHIWILGDVLKAFRELFHSVEVSANPNMFHTGNRSNVLNMANL